MSKGEETHAALLDAALAVASKDGLAGVTVGTLAETVGMSKSGLFAHFSSKENLQLEILAHAVERFREVVVTPALRAPRGEPRVVALFEHWLAWKDLLPGGCIFVAASSEVDDKPGPTRDAVVTSQLDWIDALATAARIAVKEGHFRKKLDVEQFAHDLYCIGVGHFHVDRLLRDPMARTRAIHAFQRLLRDARAAS